MAAATVFLAGLSWSGAAAADPCLAVPDQGPTPAYLSPGSSFSGPVVEVIDGDGLCVNTGGGPSDWVEVRLADFYAPELSTPEGRVAKRTLETASLGRRLDCVAEHRSYDRIVARCRLNGRPLGDLLRQDGAAEGGNAYEPIAGAAREPTGPGRATARETWALLRTLPAEVLAAVLVVLGIALVLIWRALGRPTHRPATTRQRRPAPAARRPKPVGPPAANRTKPPRKPAPRRRQR
ncbi:hypothetical protein [Phenylobacterium sp.]|uniref:thermonuclease family protein n=1 Tax=Phenylobacterium sp. TaxID=1871053 RepID=UPI00286BE03D|nr:hypothetical protein [Phenylobacterium sp.]